MSLWLVESLTISFFGIITLAVLGNALNDADARGTRVTNFGEIFIPIYIAIGFFVVYVIAMAIFACAGCCNADRRRATTSGKANDDDDDNEDIGVTPAFNARRRAAAALAATSDFSNAQEVDATSSTPVKTISKTEQHVILVDVAIDIVFAGFVLAMFIVLAHTLDRPLAAEDFTAFFVLFYIVQALYLLLLIVGAAQTYIIDHSPAGLASGGATLFGGVLCCYSASRDEMLDEAEESFESNPYTSTARKQRYDERAEFQDRPCTYIFVPYAAPSWIDWLFGIFLWLVPLAILASSILLQIYLDRAVDNERAKLAAEAALSSSTATGAPPTAAVLSLDGLLRPFVRPHHIATFAPRIPTTVVDVKMMAEFIAQAHAPATDPSGSTHNLDFGIVLLPIFIVLGILILQSFCLCAMCIYRGRTAMEWLLGSIYVLWLGLLLWFFIELAERVDFGPRADGLEDNHEDYQELFVPLYILFGLTLLIGACGFICLPSSYRPTRAYTSKWGAVVYRSG
jgi:hypothetical protein